MTSSANILDVNTSENEHFTASSVTSTCTASEAGVTGSTTITGGTFLIDSGDDNGANNIPDHPPVTVDVPLNPGVNHTIPGHLHIGNATDSFEYVFNEQT